MNTDLIAQASHEERVLALSDANERLTRKASQIASISTLQTTIVLGTGALTATFFSLYWGLMNAPASAFKVVIPYGPTIVIAIGFFAWLFSEIQQEEEIKHRREAAAIEQFKMLLVPLTKEIGRAEFTNSRGEVRGTHRPQITRLGVVYFIIVSLGLVPILLEWLK